MKFEELVIQICTPISPNLFSVFKRKVLFVMSLRAKRIALRLLSYRSVSPESVSESEGCPPGCKPKRKRETSTFTASQVDAALDLMSTNSLSELDKADFSAFGKKLSWAHLANGCVQRLAGDALQMRDLRAVSERAALLHNRLEVRRSLKIRTTQPTQNAIETLYAVTQSMSELYRLRDGLSVPDVQNAIGRAMVLKRRFLHLTEHNTDVRPRTNELEALVKSAIEAVLRADVSEGTKSFARRSLQQWTACSQPQGERVAFDSDSDCGPF
jgi:hypothetical protein